MGESQAATPRTAPGGTMGKNLHFSRLSPGWPTTQLSYAVLRRWNAPSENLKN
jgi:hypothetical protein